MNTLNKSELYGFVNQNIDTFHNQRLNALAKIKLRTILKKKNPYLFRAKDIQSPDILINSMLEALLSSSEEKIFGDFLESLAIFIAEKTCAGRKSSATGIDLEFDDQESRYLVSIKSGPNWGNSSQHRRLMGDFQTALTVQRQGKQRFYLQAILGICYGNSIDSDNGVYVTKMGQSFWALISGDADLYAELIEPIGYNAKQHNDQFRTGKIALQNRLVQEFNVDFCLTDGAIDWQKLVRFNSQNRQ